MKRPTTRYVVVCDDYRWWVGFISRESAEDALRLIENAGHCRLPHRIEEEPA